LVSSWGGVIKQFRKRGKEKTHEKREIFEEKEQTQVTKAEKCTRSKLPVAGGRRSLRPPPSGRWVPIHQSNDRTEIGKGTIGSLVK